MEKLLLSTYVQTLWTLFFVPTTDFDGTYNENSVIIEKETYL